MREAERIAAENGSTVRLTEDVTEGATGADIIYTDIWVSMGEPDEVWDTRIRLLRPYQVNRSFGAQAVKFRPIFAQATIRELPILLRASPM